MKELKIDTSGWVEIPCDKCRTVNLYDPSIANDVTECFGCMSCVPDGMPLEEYLKGKLK